MRSACRNENARHHDEGCGNGVSRIALRIELSDRMDGVGAQEDAESGIAHRRAAENAEEIAIGEKTRALIVVVGHLRHERRTRNFVEGDEGANDDGEAYEIKEKRVRGPV